MSDLLAMLRLILGLITSFPLNLFVIFSLISLVLLRLFKRK